MNAGNLKLEISGDEYRAHAVRGRVAVDELFSFVVSAVATEKPDVGAWVGKSCDLLLGSQTSELSQLNVRGMVVGASCRYVDRAFEVSVEVGPEVSPLALRRDQRVFLEKTVPEIVGLLLDEATVKHTFRLSATYVKRKSVTQRDESTWAFIARLLRDEGIWFVSDVGTDDTPLVFGDQSDAAAVVEGEALPHRSAAGLAAAGDSVRALHFVHRRAPASTTAYDLNLEKPLDPIVATAEAPDASGKALAFWADHVDTASAARARAKVRLESARRDMRRVTGASGALRLMAGRVFDVESPDAQYFCRAVDYEAVDRDDDARGQNGLRTTFEAIPARTPHRPPVPSLSRMKVAAGLSTAIVTGKEEIHPVASGAVFVQPYWDVRGKLDEKSSQWIPMAQMALFDSMVVPRIKMDAVLSLRDGDDDRPLLLGRLHDGEHPQPYALPAEKTRTVYRSETSPNDGTFHEIRFEDKKASEEIWIHASKDSTWFVGDQKEVRIGNDHRHHVGEKQSLLVKKEASVEVKLDQTVEVGTDETHEVAKDRRLQVQGNEKLSVGATRTVSAKKGWNFDVDGKRKLTVTAAMNVSADDGLKHEVLDELAATVGGAWSRKAGAGFDLVAGGDLSETIGAARMLDADKGVAVVTKGKSSETIGAAAIFDALKDLGESSVKPMSITVGGVFSVTAPSIQVIAEDEISLVCGGSSITIKKAEIEIKTAAFAAPGAMIVEKGAKVTHNP